MKDFLLSKFKKISPKVTIIIPCYNSEKYIKETIDSVKNQKYDNWECIIIDDCSTDKSNSIICDEIKNDNRFILHTFNSNKGVAKARNLGISLAKGKYLTFLDSDDLIHKDFTSDAVEFLESHKNYSAYSGKCEVEVPNNVIVHRHTYKGYKSMLESCCLVVTTVIPKDKIKCKFDSNLLLLEDWDFWINYLYKNNKVYISNKPNITYRIHFDSRTFSSNDKLGKKNILIKNYDKYLEYNKVLKISFKCFWKDSEDFINKVFIQCFNNKVLYKVVDCFNEEADIVFVSVFEEFDKSKLKGNPILISYRGEPENWFNSNDKLCKYHLSYRPTSDNNLYFPLWQIHYDDFLKYYKKEKSIKDKTDFCCWLVSNEAGIWRNTIFDYINGHYKQIDSLEAYMNNVGYILPKGDFTTPSKYKFILCFENMMSGKNYQYITEKLIWAYCYNVVPIYWGNTEVTRYFNEDSFINCNLLTKEQIVEKIKEIDNDDEKYNKMLNTFPFKENVNYSSLLQETLWSFIVRVFNKEHKNINNYAVF